MSASTGTTACADKLARTPSEAISVHVQSARGLILSLENAK